MPLNAIKPQKGHLLISEPTLNDSYFNRAVVLITEHNADGTVGFILNKPLEISLNELLKGVDDTVNPTVFFGGPVKKDNLFFIHDFGKEIEGSLFVHKNLYWGGNFEMVYDKLLENKENYNHVRFFVGYSGWEPNQLEEELNQNTWVVSDNLDERIFEIKPSKLWKDTLLNMDSDLALLGFFPDNPQLN